jgi:hypothetical protein
VSARTLARVPAIVAALGIFPVLALVVRRAVDVPFWDEWEWTELAFAAHRHTLTFARLWQPHNEHRIFFPNLIMVGLDRFGGWNPVREQLVSLVMLALTQVVVWLLIRRTVPSGRRGVCFLAASALVLGLSQYENLDWGFQLAWFLCDLCLVTAVWQLSRPGGAAAGLVVALACGVVASLTSSQGLLVWPAGLVAIALLPRGRFGRAALWTATGVVASVLARSGTPQPEAVGHDGLRAGVTSLGAYALAFLGSPVARSSGPRIALLAGCALILALAALAAAALRGPLRRRVRLVPWLAIAVYAVLCSLAIAAGRGGLGLEQATSSRYTSISELGWVAVVASACILVRRGTPLRFAAASGVAALLLVLSLTQTVAGYGAWHQRADQRRSGLRAIAEGDQRGLAVIHPDPKYVTQMLSELAQIHDGVFLGSGP